MKKIILMLEMMILSAGNVWAACPYGTTQSSEAGVCIRSGCDGNCTYYVTPASGPNLNNEYDVTVKPNEGAQGDIVLGQYWDVYGGGFKVRNMTISEGITELSSNSIVNNGSGILKLPSTLKNMKLFATYNIGFQTIDLSDVKNLESSVGGYYSLNNTITLDGVYGLQNLIVSEDTSPISIGYAYSSDNYPNREVQIQCKGTDLEKCQNLLKNQSSILSHASNFSLSADYYQGYDDKGNLVEEWDASGCKKYLYDAGGNIQRQMDDKGNILWARRIYTIGEAVHVVQPKGNTFSIKYR